MVNSYDVIIVGAGFAGLSVASELSDSGLKVLVLERKKKIFDCSSAYKATYDNTIKKFGLEKSVVKRYKKTFFYTRHKKSIINLSRENAVLIDTKKVLQTLKKKSDAEIIYDKEIIGAKRLNGMIRLSDFKGNNFTGKLVVDATGRNFALSGLIKNSLPKAAYRFYGFDIECVKVDENSAGFFLDNRFGKAGWWVYPYSKDRCQIVNCEIEPLLEVTKEHMRENLLRVLREYKLYDLKKAKITPKTELFFEIPVEPVEKMYADNFLIVGDAAGHATPILAEGIRPALVMGREAGRIIKKAFIKKDLSKKTLKKYKKIWWDKFGRYFFWGVLLRHLIILRFKNKDWDIIVSKFNKLSIDEKYDFIKSYLTPDVIAKLVSYRTFMNVIKRSLKARLKILFKIIPKKFVSSFV